MHAYSWLDWGNQRVLDVGDIEDLIADADVIDDVRFVMLDKVKEWKPARGRDKDVLDLQLIKRHGTQSFGS